MKTIQGNLIHLSRNGGFDLIVHGCNSFCTMGAGIAKGIKAAFPQAYEADLATQRGDRAKLGTCTSAEIDQNGTPLIVVNAYTQFDWRGGGLRCDAFLHAWEQGTPRRKTYRSAKDRCRTGRRGLAADCYGH